MPADYVDSHYSRTLVDDSVFPALEERHEVETCVIGGGLAGLSVALSLAERNCGVAVIEANRVGWGASGRNGGFVSAGFARGMESVARTTGTDKARALFDLSRAGVDRVRRNIEAYDIDCGPVKSGILMASWFDRPGDLRDGVAASNERYGTRLAFWPREEVQNVCSSPRYYDGIFNPDGFQFHPLNYTRGVARAADRMGVQIFEGSPVTSIRRTGSHIDVGTSRGSVRCKTVVVCCSGYIGGLVPRLSRATLPVGTYVLLTKPLGADLEEAIRTQYAVADDRMAQDYYRPLEDGRLLWGGRISTELSPARLAELMLVQIERVYPQLKDKVVPDVAWPGTMGYATHKMPQIGELEPGFWYAQGFGGHGMNTTAMAGDLIASALVDGDTRWRLFSDFGLTYAGGILGPPVAQAVYWSYQMRDWIVSQRQARHRSG